MQLSELRANVRRKIGNPTVVSVSNARIDEIINQAHRDIGDRYRFHNVRKLGTFPTVAGTKRYTVPTDLTVLMNVWNQTSKTRIRKKPFEDLGTLDIQTNQAAPTHYFRNIDWIEFTPIPDAVYTIALFYKTQVTDMVGDTAVPLLPVPWHAGLCLYARWIYFDDEGAVDKAQYARNIWKDWVSEKPVEVDEEKSSDLSAAVKLPGLAEWRGYSPTNLDFDHSDE